MAGCNLCAPINACVACAAGVYECGDLLYANSCAAKRGTVSVCNSSDCDDIAPIDPYYECSCDPCERGSGAFVFATPIGGK